MTHRDGPDFDALIGDEPLAAGERERLARVHELLLAAGPPPELPPHLASPPADTARTGRVIPFPRARWRTLSVAAAATLLLAFGVGWLVGGLRARDDVDFTVAMRGPNGAHASLAVLKKDAAGNWPMSMKVTGLKPLPAGHTYALWLTRKGALRAQCGSFIVSRRGTTTVRLNAPFKLIEYSGWVVVVSGTRTPLLQTSTV